MEGDIVKDDAKPQEDRETQKQNKKGHQEEGETKKAEGKEK